MVSGCHQADQEDLQRPASGGRRKTVEVFGLAGKVSLTNVGRDCQNSGERHVLYTICLCVIVYLPTFILRLILIREEKNN